MEEGIMKKMELNIYATTACNTGCDHCNCSSNCKNPIHFTSEMADRLVQEMQKEDLEISVFLSGGGEPLQNPELPQIVKTFNDYEKTDLIHINTSGFLEDELLRKQNLDKLIGLKMDNLIIHQSFNLYHSSFPMRLTNMVNFLLDNMQSAYLSVRPCISFENYLETLNLGEEVLIKLANKRGGIFYNLPIGYSSKERSNFYLTPNGIVTSDDFSFIWFKVMISRTHHVIKDSKKGILIDFMPFSFTREGRGKKIQETPIARICCVPMLEPDELSFIVAPDGNVYPDCDCYPNSIMSLGNVKNDPLAEIINRKDKFSKQILGRFLMDKRICNWGTSEVCVVCKQMVAEKGLIL